jgi:Uma2 family endonuclease
MSTHALVTTAEELLRMPDDGMRHELVAGELLVMAPPGIEHGRVAVNAGALLFNHARATETGVALGEAGFVLATDPDTVREPDAAFICRARADAVGRTFKYWPGAPDLAVEVISPEDRPREVDAKAREWVDAGAAAVLVLDPRTRSATVYRPGGAVSTHEDDTLDLSDAVPGWRVALADFFA